MTEKEKQVQIAIGTINIPELIPIDLHKVDANGNHPDIKANDDQFYLVWYNGEYGIGYMDDEGFCVDNFIQELQECEGIWLIKER